MRSKIIAHRGLRSRFPENTRYAIEQALLAGVDGVEFDLELTKDAHLVVLHQETLAPQNSQLAHAERNSGRIWIADSTLAEVQSLDAGSWFSPGFCHLRIPTWEEVVQLDWQSKTILAEIKDPYFWQQRNERYEARMVDLFISKLPKVTSDNLIILSFNEHILARCRKHDLNCGLNVWRNRLDRFPNLIQKCQELGIGLIQFPDDAILACPELPAIVHHAGLSIGSYSVSPAYLEPEFSHWNFASYRKTLQRLLKLNVDYIITDFAVETLEYYQNDLRHS